MAAKDSVRSPAVEDYAKAIFSLQSRGAEPVSTNALAERLEITSGSVSAMLKKLDELGLITHVPYRGVRLTAERAIDRQAAAEQLAALTEAGRQQQRQAAWLIQRLVNRQNRDARRSAAPDA